ncbi:hypothetical protein SDC9_72107 [bioreactor metagenome]|uniref:Uncharacterized protein n=1 Tax=bioreactor metagenome TaxID=1076179 RepID=A0A644YAU2_9ZZZZ
MADFAASRTSCSTSAADRELWEVVMVDESLAVDHAKAVDDLMFAQWSQCTSRQRLRLSTREQAGTVYAR